MLGQTFEIYAPWSLNLVFLNMFRTKNKDVFEGPKQPTQRRPFFTGAQKASARNEGKASFPSGASTPHGHSETIAQCQIPQTHSVHLECPAVPLPQSPSSLPKRPGCACFEARYPFGFFQGNQEDTEAYPLWASTFQRDSVS